MSYLKSDYRSLELHKLVTEKLIADYGLIEVVFLNIRLWKEKNNMPQSYLDDWLFHINMGREHLLSFLVSETEEAQRLRSSSPFVGILGASERLEIFGRFR